MKEITFIRHAKSSWDDSCLNDLERPLNKRGKHDAPLMGDLLKKNLLKPDLCISSPAKRAFSTAVRIAAFFDYKKKNIVKEDKLYMAELTDFLEIIHRLPPRFSHVFIFSHNPGITDTVNRLSGGTITNIPTCGVAQVRFKVQDWQDIQPGAGELTFWDFPKNYY